MQKGFSGKRNTPQNATKIPQNDLEHRGIFNISEKEKQRNMTWPQKYPKGRNSIISSSRAKI